MSYIGNQITGFLGTGSLTVTTSTVAVEGDALFSADGNVVIGDASGDTITINAATASIPNNLNIDSNTLFLNASNNRVGIGNASPATALDVTGTITSDGLTVDGTSSEVISVNSTANGSQIFFNSATTSSDWIAGISNDATDDFLIYQGASGTGDIRLYTKDKKRLEIDADGDISFYEDTGTTAKLFWDASAEALGLGTSSPDYMLDIEASSPTARLNSTANNGVNTIWFGHSDDADAGAIRYWGSASGLGSYANSLTFNTNGTQAVHIDASQNVGIGTTSLSTNTLIKELHIDSPITNGLSRLRLSSSVENMEALISLSGYLGDDSLIFSIGSSGDGSATERMRIDSSGNVGIGTSSPSAPLTVSKSSGYTEVTVASGSQEIDLFTNSTGSTCGLLTASNIPIAFYNNSTERMRIDSTGNLLVGKTTASISTTGSELRNDGYVIATFDGDAPLYLNRLTSDGDIAKFYKDGNFVGSIKSYNGSFLQIESAGNQSGLLFGTSAYYPVKNGSLDNGNIDLGNGSNRFKDLYLSGSVYLGGTGSANALDDYEEGAWTPTISGITYATADGHYIKIGNKVHLMGIFVNASTTASSANAILGGMPFTVSNDNLSGTSLEGSGFFQYWNNLQIAASAIYLTPIQNDTTCNVYYVPASGVSSGGEISQLDRQYLDASNVSIRFNITYFTD